MRGFQNQALSTAIRCAALAAALVVSPAALAQPATTKPSSTLIVEVVVTAKGVVVGKFASSATHDGFIPLGGPIPRGDYLNFRVLNRGRSALRFTVFGRTTQTLKPGASGGFHVLALRRGTFPYRTTTASGKVFQGSLSVI